MSTRAEQYGARLIMLMRQRQQLLKELEMVTEKIDDLNSEILGEESGRLYSTGEIPVVPDERPTQVMPAPQVNNPDHWAWARQNVHPIVENRGR